MRQLSLLLLASLLSSAVLAQKLELSDAELKIKADSILQEAHLLYKYRVRGPKSHLYGPQSFNYHTLHNSNRHLHLHALCSFIRYRFIFNLFDCFGEIYDV
jgi:hypothetical protein